ncbi:MAG: (d)CMP kinase [Bacillota bacterium]|nr:(d)CMP kinase [Bacillota bacterium]
MKLNVAIDGPAGAGKSTIAKLVGKRYGLMYINTGAMYRAVTLTALRRGIGFNDVMGLTELIKGMEMHFENDDLYLNGDNVQEEITTPYISKNVSDYAAVSEVRKMMVSLQQQMGQKYNVIMDGRDIGTVVLKDAAIKFFLTASAEERAKRRHKELIDKGINVLYEDVLNDIIRRDDIDSNRKADPLKKADDAILVDCSNLSIEEVVNLLSSYIDKVI